MAALQGPGSAAQGSPAELEVPQVTKVGVGVLLVKRPPEEGGEPLVLVGRRCGTLGVVKAATVHNVRRARQICGQGSHSAQCCANAGRQAWMPSPCAPRLSAGCACRKGSHGAGTYALPGGHLEFGEGFEQCGAREVLEETGIDLTGNLKSIQLAYATSDLIDGSKHYVTVFVRAQVPDVSVPATLPKGRAGSRVHDKTDHTSTPAATAGHRGAAARTAQVRRLVMGALVPDPGAPLPANDLAACQPVQAAVSTRLALQPVVLQVTREARPNKSSCRYGVTPTITFRLHACCSSLASQVVLLAHHHHRRHPPRAVLALRPHIACTRPLSGPTPTGGTADSRAH